MLIHVSPGKVTHLSNCLSFMAVIIKCLVKATNRKKNPLMIQDYSPSLWKVKAAKVEADSQLLTLSRAGN